LRQTCGLIIIIHFQAFCLDAIANMTDLTQLRSTIQKGAVLVPGDDGYEASIKRWSAAVEKRAAVVVKAADQHEVASAIKFAVANAIPLTACGGGHASSGTSSSEGMVIDLSMMRSVTVNEEEMTVSFEGGCLWKDVERALDPLGLATVGGVVNHTGVGGLIVGGGHGYLTAQHGLTIDNLITVQVVTADGSILEANDKENADLFWAIRGAGAQFGIVTRFESRVHKQGPVWSGSLTFTAEKLPQIVDAANSFHDADNREGHCMVIGIGYAPDGSHSLTVSTFYNGPEAEGRQFFHKVLEIEAIGVKTSMMTMGQVNQLLNPLSYHGIRRLMGSGNVVMPLSATDLRATAEKFWAICEAHPEVGVQSAIAIELFPTHKIREVPLEATAYTNRGDYYDAVTMWGWEDASLDGEVRAANRKLVSHIRNSLGYKYNPEQDGKQDAPVGRYINLETDPIRPEDAYGVNLGRLRGLKAKYDPGNVFHKWHGINLQVD